jgi:transcriptional regulator with XRE-family HTH domain
MHRWSLTRKETARHLGVGERMIYWYLSGKHVVPKTVSLLMQALEENWKFKSQ